MKCPECGADCWREEVDVGVGIITSPWMCIDCGWDEDLAFPMADYNWDEWLNEGPSPDAYVCH
jgi:hypothetical protein